jgi:hypothetical protein
LFSKTVHFALVEGTTDVWTLSDRSQDIIQEVDQKLKGPLSLRSSSSRRPLQVDLSKLETSSLKRYRRVYNLREVTSSCKVTSKSRHLIVGRVNRDSICVLSKVDLWFSCLEYYYLPFLDFSDTVCYFLQEELIAAVAQHFAAQV